MRNETFFSLADAKEAVAEKLEELNGYAFKKREGNRRDAYIHEEKEFMQPLPDNPYERLSGRIRQFFLIIRN